MIHKRIISIIICITLLAFATVSVLADENDEQDMTVTNGCHSLDASVPFLGQGKLIDNAQSIFLFETGSQTLMYAWNADEAVYPASFVKLMTALLVLENGHMEDIVTVSADAINSVSYDAISADLAEGEQISVSDLFYCMLVSSANDAAAVLAEYISGSQSAFIDLMNQRAIELGCTGTYFVNPHGLHHDDQVMTARDAGRIIYAALDYEAFRDAIGAVYYTVSETNMHGVRYLSSNNYLMNTDTVGIHFDGRVTGGRTGVTTDDLRNVASVSEDGNMELICIVMGSTTSYLSGGNKVNSFGGFPETSMLLDMAYSGMSKTQVIFKNQVLRQQTVVNGESDVFVASFEDFSTVLPDTVSFDQLTYQYVDAPGADQAPIAQGQNMASLQVWYDSMCVAQTDIYAMNSVSVAANKVASRGENEQSLSALGWIIIVILIILLIAASLFVFLRRSGRHGKKDGNKHNKPLQKRRKS